MVDNLQLGYWIVEPLVDRKTEFYPRGGIKQLVGINSITQLIPTFTFHLATGLATAS